MNPESQTPRMSPEQRKKYLENRLQKLVAFGYANSPALKIRMEKVGVVPSQIANLEGLKKIPVLRKDDLINLHKQNPPFGGLLTTSVTDLERIYVSPGPIFDPHHHDKTYWERHVEALYGIGFRPRDIVVNTWSYHLVPAGHLVDTALRQIGATVIPMGPGNTKLQVQVIYHFQATGFAGSTSFLMNIIRKAEEMGYNVHDNFPLKLAYAGSEMGSKPIKKTIEKDYCIPCRDLYATADLGIIAYECEQENGMHIAQDVIAEIVDPASGEHMSPGEKGELVLTPLNMIYPLIRFGTGDISALIEEPCACGRTSPRLAGILGRVGAAVRVRGMNIHPSQLAPALSKMCGVLKFQAIVTRPELRDEITLKVELSSHEFVDKKQLSHRLFESFYEAARIKLDRIEFVQKGVIPEDPKLIVDERESYGSIEL